MYIYIIEMMYRERERDHVDTGFEPYMKFLFPALPPETFQESSGTQAKPEAVVGKVSLLLIGTLALNPHARGVRKSFPEGIRNRTEPNRAEPKRNM